MLSLIFLVLPCACDRVNDTEKGYFVDYAINAEQLYIDGKKISNSDYNALVKDAGELIRSIERQVSVEFEDSDISRINSAEKDEIIQVGEHTYKMLSLSKELFVLTGGKFSPALFNLSQLWGFSPEFEGEYTKSRPTPSDEFIQTAKINSDFSQLELLGNNCVKKTNSQLKLDLGGIAKGYMSDCLRELIVNEYTGKKVEGSITVMSNSILLGEIHDGNSTRYWRVDVENPRRLTVGNGTALFLPEIKDCAITTSSDSYRFFVNKEKIYSHIIDYETGKPADNGIISVTILVPLTVTNCGAFADALSTAGFCMKLTDALSFYSSMSERFGVSAIVICSDFNYYTVGDTVVQNLNEISDEYENVFTKNDILNATDDVTVCEKEREYMIKVGEIYE